MEILKRKMTVTIQVEGLRINENGIGTKWVPEIEKTFYFTSYMQFVEHFKITDKDKISYIKDKYENCEKAIINIGKGNEIFYFKNDNQ